MPNDLDKIFSVESCRKININSFVRQASKSLKQALLAAQLETLGQTVLLTTTKTRYGGERYWFICPTCAAPKGVLYEQPLKSQLVCRTCMKLFYSKQMYR